MFARYFTLHITLPSSGSLFWWNKKWETHISPHHSQTQSPVKLVCRLSSSTSSPSSQPRPSSCIQQQCQPRVALPASGCAASECFPSWGKLDPTDSSRCLFWGFPLFFWRLCPFLGCQLPGVSFPRSTTRLQGSQLLPEIFLPKSSALPFWGFPKTAYIFSGTDLDKNGKHFHCNTFPRHLKTFTKAILWCAGTEWGRVKERGRWEGLWRGEARKAPSSLRSQG